MRLFVNFRMKVTASNLNLGQDTRANRTRNTSSRSTKPHTKQQHTNAHHETDRPHAHTQ